MKSDALDRSIEEQKELDERSKFHIDPGMNPTKHPNQDGMFGPNTGASAAGFGMTQNYGRGEFVGREDRRSTVLNGLGQIPKGAERELPDLSRSRGGEHQAKDLGPVPGRKKPAHDSLHVRQKAQPTVITWIGKGSRPVVISRSRNENNSKPPGRGTDKHLFGSGSTSTSDQKAPAQSDTRASEDDWMAELSPRKKPCVAESEPIISTSDYLDELSPSPKKSPPKSVTVGQLHDTPSSAVAAGADKPTEVLKICSIKWCYI